MNRITSGIALLIVSLACMASEAQTYTDTHDEAAWRALRPYSGQTYTTVLPGAILGPQPGSWHSDGNDQATYIAGGDGRGVDGRGDVVIYWSQPVCGVGVRYLGNTRITVFDENLAPLHQSFVFGADRFAGVSSDECAIVAAVFHDPFRVSQIIDNLYWHLASEVITVCIYRGGVPQQAYAYLWQGEPREQVGSGETEDGCSELVVETGGYGVYLDAITP